MWKLTDDEGEHKCPHRELRVPHLNRHDAEDKHCNYKNTLVRGTPLVREVLTEDHHVPPFGNLGVLGHQARVDIRLLTHRAPRLHPDLLAEVEERVRERRGDRRKRQAVGYGESRRQE